MWRWCVVNYYSNRMRLKSGWSRRRYVSSWAGFCGTPVRACMWGDVQRSGTVCEAVEAATKVFRAHGVDEARLSAEHIATKTFSELRSRGDLRVRGADMVLEHRDAERREFVRLCKQRKELKKPIQYLVGHWDFHYITINVRAPMLIPRPETEQLVQMILEHNRSQEISNVMDIGCGSGCILLSLINVLRCNGVGMDISKEAIDLTSENMKLLGLQRYIKLILLKDNNLHNFIHDPHYHHQRLHNRTYDMIVSNPPYIPTNELSTLSEQILLHEDIAALDGGVDGLQFIKQILSVAPKLLKPGGQLWMEVDSSHPSMLKSMKVQGLRFVGHYKDYYGNERFVQWQAI